MKKVFQKKDITKILIIQTAKIGDLVCSTPIFRELKLNLKNSHLTVMVNPIAKEIIENNPYIDEIIPINKKHLKVWKEKFKIVHFFKKNQFDIVILLNPDVFFVVATLWALIPLRIGIKPNFCGLTKKLSFPLYTYLVSHKAGQHIILTYLKLLKFLGIQNLNFEKDIFLDKKIEKTVNKYFINTQKPYIGIVVSSGNKLKSLNPKKWSVIINGLLKNINGTIFLIGSKEDEEAAKEISTLVKEKEKIVDTTGKFRLKEIPNFIRKLNLLIGVDTGIIYIADALKIPIIHLAGPVDTSEQRPLQSRCITLQLNLPCVPCSFIFKTVKYCKLGKRICIENIKVEEVILAAKKLLSVKKSHSIEKFG